MLLAVISLLPSSVSVSETRPNGFYVSVYSGNRHNQVRGVVKCSLEHSWSWVVKLSLFQKLYGRAAGWRVRPLGCLRVTEKRLSPFCVWGGLRQRCLVWEHRCVYFLLWNAGKGAIGLWKKLLNIFPPDARESLPPHPWMVRGSLSPIHCCMQSYVKIVWFGFVKHRCLLEAYLRIGLLHNHANDPFTTDCTSSFTPVKACVQYSGCC